MAAVPFTFFGGRNRRLISIFDGSLTTMRRKYTTYQELLETALAEWDSFTLVWRNLVLEEPGRELELQLEPWLLEWFEPE